MSDTLLELLKFSSKQNRQRFLPTWKLYFSKLFKSTLNCKGLTTVVTFS